jgi:hypothetical protein
VTYRPADSLGGDLTPRISVVEVCRRAAVTPRYYYQEVKAGRAPKPKPWHGLTLSEARAWLAARSSKKALKAEADRRLRESARVAEAKGDI